MDASLPYMWPPVLSGGHCCHCPPPCGHPPRTEILPLASPYVAAAITPLGSDTTCGVASLYLGSNILGCSTPPLKSLHIPHSSNSRFGLPQLNLLPFYLTWGRTLCSALLNVGINCSGKKKKMGKGESYIRL